jgi:hypothetical protein
MSSVSPAEFHVPWAMCLLDVISVCETTVTISSAFFKYNINCNVWTSDHGKWTEAIIALPATMHHSLWSDKDRLPDKTTDPVHDCYAETAYNNFTESPSTEHQCR